MSLPAKLTVVAVAGNLLIFLLAFFLSPAPEMTIRTLILCAALIGYFYCLIIGACWMEIGKAAKIFLITMAILNWSLAALLIPYSIIYCPAAIFNYY